MGLTAQFLEIFQPPDDRPNISIPKVHDGLIQRQFSVLVHAAVNIEQTPTDHSVKQESVVASEHAPAVEQLAKIIPIRPEAPVAAAPEQLAEIIPIRAEAPADPPVYATTPDSVQIDPGLIEGLLEEIETIHRDRAAA